MCHLVTWFKSKPKSTELNVMQTFTYESEDMARREAELLLHSGCSEVRVWKLVGSPALVPSVVWS